jgi:putative PIN family toxin of toxin-antitoxin system
VRAVLDVTVLISALLSREGAPARIVLAWLNGSFELVVSPMLIEELRRARAYAKIRRRIPEADAERFISILLDGAMRIPDPAEAPPLRSTDAADDYLIGLAAASDALLVSGDGHLLELADRAPIHTPAEFADMIESA